MAVFDLGSNYNVADLVPTVYTNSNSNKITFTPDNTYDIGSLKTPTLFSELGEWIGVAAEEWCELVDDGYNPTYATKLVLDHMPIGYREEVARYFDWPFTLPPVTFHWHQSQASGAPAFTYTPTVATLVHPANASLPEYLSADQISSYHLFPPLQSDENDI